MPVWVKTLGVLAIIGLVADFVLTHRLPEHCTQVQLASTTSSIKIENHGRSGSFKILTMSDGSQCTIEKLPRW